jgi:endonuclease III
MLPFDEQRARRVAQRLLDNRKTVNWEWIRENKDRESSNKFLLPSILNYHVRSASLYDRVTKFLAGYIRDPNNLWHEVAKMGHDNWMSNIGEHGLHPLRQANERVWRIANELVANYGGDASRIWREQTVVVVQRRLEELRVGDQISRMIVGALCDTGWLESAAADVKADRHLTRVVGRIFFGESITSAKTLDVARTMHPANPWLLDKPLFDVGQQYCRPRNPKCEECYLRSECCYILRGQQQSGS